MTEKKQKTYISGVKTALEDIPTFVLVDMEYEARQACETEEVRRISWELGHRSWVG